MKLKLRFDKKRMIHFIIFAVILLYLVGVAVANLVTFSKTAHFYGLIPNLAFNSDYFTTTIIIYIITLICLVVSCGNYFFEFDNGFGFSTEKKSDGYNHWCDSKTMKKELKMINSKDRITKYGGIPLINNGKQMWVDDGEYHNLIIGSTGSGKTQAIIFPMVHTLSKHGESMIITDPKGEIYEKTKIMLEKQGYEIILLNFRNPQQGNAWNPLSLPYRLWKSGNQDKAIELLDDLALNILYDESSKNADPFWEKTSADYFSGIALGLFEDATEEQININSISLMSTVGEEKFKGSTYIKEYFNGKDPAGAAYTNASSTILAPSDTKGSIIAVFKQKIKLFASRVNLSEMLSYSNFSIENIGTKKTALFIVIQDEKKTYHSLATILVKQIYETLIDVAQNNGGKLPIRTNFLLDEFANMPPLKDVTTMITAARSRAMRFTMIIQNFAQLNEVYGEQSAETIKGNCGNLIYLISTELKALEEISKMCGEVKSKKDDKTVSTPLITISDLQKLKMFEVIVRRLRIPPFKTKLTPNYKMDWGRVYPSEDLMHIKPRVMREIQTFDVREFVKAKNQEKMANMMSDSSSGGFSPLFPGSNPFMPSPSMFNEQNMFKNNNNNNELKNQDIDDMVKKIEAQIAKIEAEESKIKNDNKDNIELDNIINNSIIEQENKERIDKLFNEDNSNNKSISNDKNDDEFFDDFFE